jgi:hypothetical protein
MTDMRTLLQQADVRRALIVDDAYDPVPLARDLSREADEWTQFFEDLTTDDLMTLRQIYPRYDDFRADELQRSDDFVATLWEHRSRLSGELGELLFARYQEDVETDRAHLTKLLQWLGDFGLTCDTAGRTFQDKAIAADLIVIDLYLGSTQDDMTISIDGLVKVIEKRRNRPPLVVLMSRSPRLAAKREEFRDRSGLFESAFRIIHKAELADPSKLQRLLRRLGSHYSDSLKLASFLDAWNTGLNHARERTSSLIRRLDLADHAQIRQLLLSAEGEPTGSYLVDVFDRVLQHEIEREASIIDAAIALNTLTSETYPPPYVAGSRDLQNLVHRSLFQNRERLRLMGAEGSRVAFGDLLRRKPKALPAGPETVATPADGAPLSDLAATDVLSVLTPACDLQRQGAKRVLLLVGALRSLQPADWSYKDDPVRTPVVELSDGQRWWIKWDLKHIETLSHNELARMLIADGDFEIVARLRESHALELQQKLLSSLGRVGLIAPMPATFPMRVEAYLPNMEGKLVRIDIPALEQFDGVCYVGRAGKGDMRLVLCDDACEAICEAVEKVELAQVHAGAHEPVTYLQKTGELLQVLEGGVSLPSPEAQGFKDIPSPSGARKGDSPNARPRIIGLVKRNGSMDSMTLSGGEIAKAGIVLATWDH